MTIFDLWKIHEMPKPPFAIYLEKDNGDIEHVKITAIVFKTRTEPQFPEQMTFYGESPLDCYSGDCHISGMNVSHNAVYRKGWDFGIKKESSKKKD